MFFNSSNVIVVSDSVDVYGVVRVKFENRFEKIILKIMIRPFYKRLILILILVLIPILNYGPTLGKLVEEH